MVIWVRRPTSISPAGLCLNIADFTGWKSWSRTFLSVFRPPFPPTIWKNHKSLSRSTTGPGVEDQVDQELPWLSILISEPQRTRVMSDQYRKPAAKPPQSERKWQVMIWYWPQLGFQIGGFGHLHSCNPVKLVGTVFQNDPLPPSLTFPPSMSAVWAQVGL